jgi:hypothetical protein
MSNSKTVVSEIKSLMKQFGFLQEEVTLLSFKLEDNTILQTPKLEVGSKINKINELFEVSSLEDGTYRLVENFSIEVKESEILSVKEIFISSKLVDGTEVKVSGDSLVEGAKVMVVTDQGEVPAPDATHELEDGTKITTKDGMIVSIEEALGDVEVEDPEVPEMEQPEVGMEKEMMEMLKEFVKKMGEKMSQMEQSYSSLQNEFNQFKQEPAGRKISDGKTETFNKQELSDEDSRVNTILAFRNKK